MKKADTRKSISEYRLEVENVISEADDCIDALRLISESFNLFLKDDRFTKLDEYNLIAGRGRIYSVLELVCNQLVCMQKEFYAIPINEQPEQEEQTQPAG